MAKYTPEVRGKSMPLAMLLVVMGMLMLVVLTSNQAVEARYLPTRADESQAEVLKEIIRNLLNEANNNDNIDNDQMVRQARFFANTSRAQRLLKEAYAQAGSVPPLRNLRQRRAEERVALDGVPNGGDLQQSNGLLKQLQGDR